MISLSPITVGQDYHDFMCKNSVIQPMLTFVVYEVQTFMTLLCILNLRNKTFYKKWRSSSVCSKPVGRNLWCIMWDETTCLKKIHVHSFRKLVSSSYTMLPKLMIISRLLSAFRAPIPVLYRYDTVSPHSKTLPQTSQPYSVGKCSRTCKKNVTIKMKMDFKLSLPWQFIPWKLVDISSYNNLTP